MHSTQGILDILKANKARLQQQYPIGALGLFGSYARADANPQSDIDILVDINGRIGLGIIKLAHELEDLLNTKVDLAVKSAIKPKYWEYLKKDVIYV